MPQFTYNMPLEIKLLHDIGLDFLLVEDEKRLELLQKKSQKTKSKALLQNALTQKKLAQNLKHSQVQESSFENKKIIFTNDDSAKIEQNKNTVFSPRSSEEAKEIEENAKEVSLSMQFLPFFEWSPEWKELFARCHREQSKVAWTYTGLHADMLASEKLDAQRQNVIRRVLPKLARPNGTHIFIPYDTFDEPGKLLQENDYSFYWSAIKYLKIRYLLVFGSKARDSLYLPKKNKYSSFVFHGLKVNILPDLNNIGQDEENSLYTFLDGQLKSVDL